jgi:hypothetical protein
MATENTIQGLEISPNPANDVLKVSYDTQLTGNIKLCILDFAGRKVWQEIIGNKNEGEINVDLGKLQNGLYMVALIEDGILQSRAKLMIAK